MEDYEQAAEEFKTLVLSKDLKFHIQKLSEYKEQYTTGSLAVAKHSTVMLPFSVVIGQGTGGFGAFGFARCVQTVWTCGEDIAYHWAAELDRKMLCDVVCNVVGWGNTVGGLDIARKILNANWRHNITRYEAEVLESARRNYCPSIVDVMHSLVLDSSYLDDPDSFGELFEDGAKAIRAWEQIKVTAPKVREMFGSNWQQALDLTGQM